MMENIILFFPAKLVKQIKSNPHFQFGKCPYVASPLDKLGVQNVITLGVSKKQQYLWKRLSDSTLKTPIFKIIAFSIKYTLSEYYPDL